MTYEPISEDKKQEWIDWLDETANILRRKPNLRSQNRIFETPEGDIRTAKDLVGNLLALLTNTPIEL